MASHLLEGAGVFGIALGLLATYAPKVFKAANDGVALLASNRRLTLETQKENREERKGIVEERDRYYKSLTERDEEVRDLKNAAFEKEQRCILAGKPCDRFILALTVHPTTEKENPEP